MLDDGKIWLANNDFGKVYLYPQMSNRHGLIAGASGTGKTVTLRVLAESFSDLDVPVFLADMKGDLGGMCNEGDPEKMKKRLNKFGIEEFAFEGVPTCFWDVFGEKGVQIKATIDSMGPMLLSRLMELSDVQADVLNIIFHIAEDRKWSIVNIQDLRKIVEYVTDHREKFISKYGTMSPQSLGAIQRSILVLEDIGGDVFFGLPEFDVMDLLGHYTEEADGRQKGVVNILHSVKLANNPQLYAVFLVWLLSQLYDKLDEQGDADKPRLVFFFDEAHMLFDDPPKAMVQKVEQIVRLIRSKGVGIYFISQSPSDIPDKILAQLSNRVQHALRAYTPSEQKSVKAAADAFRPNPRFKTDEVIMDLGVGEALVSCLDEEGRPSIVERAYILPPKTMLGALDEETYQMVIDGSGYKEIYDVEVEHDYTWEKIERMQEGEKEEEDRQKAMAAQKKEEQAAQKKAASAPKVATAKPRSSSSTSRSSSGSKSSSSSRSSSSKSSSAKKAPTKKQTSAVVKLFKKLI